MGTCDCTGVLSFITCFSAFRLVSTPLSILCPLAKTVPLVLV